MLSAADMKKFGIEIATAKAGKLPVDISLPGKVTVNEDRIAHVTPRVPGVVREVRKTLGDYVHAGEIMAILDSPEMGEAQVSYLGAKTALNVAKANVDLAATKLQVAKAQRDVAQTQMEVTQTNHDLAVTHVATVETAADVKRAEAKMQRPITNGVKSCTIIQVNSSNSLRKTRQSTRLRRPSKANRLVKIENTFSKRMPN